MEIEESTEKNPTCELKEIDEEGRPNLCCCYFMDEDGQIQDPCPLPVQYCC
jgi:hypothetical protein